MISNYLQQQQHDYLRDTLLPIYKECISCNARTQFTCVKCGFCYSCHWKKEKLERAELEGVNFEFLEKDFQPATIILEHSSAGQKAIDVYGQQIEPICNYRTCSHRFSTHGHSGGKCKCRHTLNYATGISLWSR